MKYLNRAAERKFKEMSSFFKAVLVTGARQTGKTTMLRHMAEAGRRYVTLDDLIVRELAKSDPALFFQTYKPPLIIDEVQYAPELFPYIKIICDESESAGLFWLTGSQQYSLMRNVRESLAGRIGIMELYGLSWREKRGMDFCEVDFSLDALIARNETVGDVDVVSVFDHIWEGGMPQAAGAKAELRDEYYNSYVSAYLMRDAAEIGKISAISEFSRFLRACAALIGQQVRYSTLAEAAGISEPTAKAWLGVLEGMGVVYLLRPYSNNAFKRLTKAPKLYFCDTGIGAYLSMWLTSDALRVGAASGHFYENYAVMELVKNIAYSSQRMNLSYYRDSNGNEIDLIAECGGTLHPFEIKKTASPDKRAIKKFDLLDKASDRGAGGIICMIQDPLPIDGKNCMIPSKLL